MRHLRLVPKPTPRPSRNLTDLPQEIIADLDDVRAAVESKVRMQDVAGYGLKKQKPEFITVVEHGTSRLFNIDIRHVNEDVRQTDEYIDVLFESHGLR